MQELNNDTLPLDIIRQSAILTESDLNQLTPLKEELRETFLKAQIFRTRTEAETSVLNMDKHPTPAAKYWQSVREQNVHFHELVMLSYEYRKAVVELKKIERDIDKHDDELDKEIDVIEIEKRKFILANMERVAKDRIREIKMWSDIKAREAESMTPAELDNVDNHQLKSYSLRHYHMARKMGDGGGPAERQNVLGQLRSCFKLCNERGILEDVLIGVKTSDKHEILSICGLNNKQLTEVK